METLIGELEETNSKSSINTADLVVAGVAIVGVVWAGRKLLRFAATKLQRFAESHQEEK